MSVTESAGKIRELLDKYLPNSDRNALGGKLTARDVVDFIAGKTPEEMALNALPVGMVVNPARKPSSRVVTMGADRASKTLRKILGVAEKTHTIDQSMDDQMEGAYSAVWDKKHRKNISDTSVRLDATKVNSRRSFKGKLGDLISHDTLFEYYPGLRNYPVEVSIDPFGKQGGSLNANRIRAFGHDHDDVTSTILHEIQHWIQETEGWASGSSLKQVEKDPSLVSTIRRQLLDTLGISPKGERVINTPLGEKPANKMDWYSKYLAYWKQAGEAEARDTSEKWLAWKQNQNAKYYPDEPLSSQPLSPDELLVNYDYLGIPKY